MRLRWLTSPISTCAVPSNSWCVSPRSSRADPARARRFAQTGGSLRGVASTASSRGVVSQSAEETAQQRGRARQVLGHGMAGSLGIAGQYRLHDVLVLAGGVVDVALQDRDGVEQVVQPPARVGAGGGEQAGAGQLGDAEMEERVQPPVVLRAGSVH